MCSRVFEKPDAAKQTSLCLNVVPVKVKFSSLVFLVCLISQGLALVLVAVLGVKDNGVCALTN